MRVTTGPVSAISPGRAAGAGRGATIFAATCSAALHGALAAGVFLWPTGPVPYSIGDPIVVELVAEAPEDSIRGPTAGSASADVGPAADTSVALSPQSDPDNAESPPDTEVAAAPERPVETAALAAPPASQAATPAPVVPRPARRPPAPPPEHGAHSPSGIEKPPAASPTIAGPAMAPPAGAAISSAAAGNARAGGATAAATSVGPRFVAGSPGNPLPRYPPTARRRGLEGRVVLRVLVATDGRAEAVSVQTGSLHPILDAAAAETLRRWRFEPAHQAGVPVAAWVDVPIVFRLSD
jgi:protein TonB